MTQNREIRNVLYHKKTDLIFSWFKKSVASVNVWKVLGQRLFKLEKMSGL